MDHTLTIEKIIHGGRGLARLDNNMVVLVPFVLPGETVVARERKMHRSYLEADLVEILQPSADRIEAPCPYYAQCGGCNFQHMTASAQQQAKENILREALGRAGIFLPEGIFSPILTSPVPYHYRYRIRLQVDEEGRIGFYKAASNSIVDINSCLIATIEINETLQQIRSALPPAICRLLSEIELLQSPADDAVHCIFHIRQDTPSSATATAGLIKAYPTPFSTISIKRGRNIESMQNGSQPVLLRQDFTAGVSGAPYSLAWHPGSFFQVNARQNPALVGLVCSLAGDCADRRVLDLYCGAGNFAIPLALEGGIVTGVEHDAAGIAQARENARQSRIKIIHFHAANVQKWLRSRKNRTTGWDIIVLDPPRQGMGREAALLAEQGAEKIIYVSCDPATLARDASLLISAGYRIVTVRPVDMFPQTHHIESVVLLEKN